MAHHLFPKLKKYGYYHKCLQIIHKKVKGRELSTIILPYLQGGGVGGSGEVVMGFFHEIARPWRM